MLAAWRIAYLLVNEYGFMGIAQRLRDFFGVTNAPLSEQNPIAGLLSCVACCSFWVALFIPWLPDWLRVALNIAGGALLIHKGIGYIERLIDAAEELPDMIVEAIHA